MPCKYSIHPEFKLIWNRLHGNLFIHELKALTIEFRADPDYEPSFAVIQDARHLQADQLTFLEMVSLTRELTDYRATLQAPLHCALIAPGDIAFGMARMFQSLMANCEGARILVTRETHEATRFLGLPPTGCAMIDAEEQALPST